LDRDDFDAVEKNVICCESHAQSSRKEVFIRAREFSRAGKPTLLKKILSICLSVFLVAGVAIDAVGASASAATADAKKSAAPSVIRQIDNADDTQEHTVIPVPEPSSIALMLAGALTFAGMAVLRRRAHFDP
jgi:hypothetical protein